MTIPSSCSVTDIPGGTTIPDQPSSASRRPLALLLGAFLGGAVAAALERRRHRAIEARHTRAAAEREAERTRLTGQLVTAEQDERRRLSLFLHDGPLQSLSGIALMHDAALAALREGRTDEAAAALENALERERETIRTLRNLSFAIEPVILRDQGFAAAVRALADQIEEGRKIGVTLDVAAGDGLGEKAQVALYQTIREALDQAVRRGPTRVSVGIEQRDDGGYAAAIADDGVGERRSASLEAIGERARILNGKISLESGADGGNVVLVTLPPYVAAAT